MSELTADEQEAMKASAELANAMRRVIGDGPQAEHDWAEVAHDIHNIQARILSQVAARMGLARPLGGTFNQEQIFDKTSRSVTTREAHVVAHDAVAGALDSGIVQETGSDQVHDPRVFHPESECDWCAAHPERRVSRG